MVRMFIRHRVRDFESWKEVYDELSEERRARGARESAVYRSTDDPCVVTVWSDFDDLDDARSYVLWGGLHEAMERAGVEGEPTIWFARKV